MIINTAVLHVLNFSNHTVTLSEKTLNLEDEVIRKYTERMIKKAFMDGDVQKGTFEDDSPFLHDLQLFENKETGFLDFTIQTVNAFQDIVKDVCSRPLSILFAHFESDEIPYMAMIILEDQAALIHHTEMDDESVYNNVIYGSDILPSPDKKINGYAIFNLLSNEISYRDEITWNISDLHVMQDMVFHCTAGTSPKEVLESITQITNDIAEEFDQNPTVLLTKVKRYIKDSVEDEKPVEKEDLAIHVFNESDEMQNSFLSKSSEADLPATVELPKKVISREMKTQRIRTDNGITIAFPIEFARDPSKIEFIYHDDGTITIELKHINHISNRK